MKYYDYGQKFKQLRKQRNISLKTAAQVINTSRQRLGNWENGRGNLGFEEVIQLLKYFEINPTEFIDSSLKFYDLTSEIKSAYINNDTAYLKNYASDTLTQAQGHLTDKDRFLKGIIACNFYYELTQKDISSKQDKVRLRSFFSNIDSGERNWTMKDVYVFGNTQHMMSSSEIYSLSYSLVFDGLEHKYQSKEWKVAIISSLLNANFILIVKDLKKAESLYKLLDSNKNKFSDLYANEKIRLAFIKEFIIYSKNPSKQNRQIIKEMLESLNLFNLSDLEEGLRFALGRIDNHLGLHN
ncbi:transcriptional regulator [Lactobacillus pasteurii DSM 23907 = CRBIP 24.76]|uniref:Transcriptional regulator n=1 Tax=Lactobacillus pasteurii DSM 23907 = CRBIP 24.76 TaxID=1423790 RepID=I7KL63_9LACO|nr:Rgg/GadR/MutR family transcriptional regulator [Lactobacillus pasteurii]KRK08007.1 transcriptional regulator [Lactobacillus pasteurii DSM 23907 = CRBIP 24.76]TDG75959.1 hypothetical protein C5L33_001517 [Lactobacillus pasteurii]CCI85129.1 Transcriptional regulator [Lactobacillus pasteurii DSM 23907 = CRBIP 24.76]